MVNAMKKTGSFSRVKLIFGVWGQRKAVEERSKVCRLKEERRKPTFIEHLLCVTQFNDSLYKNYRQIFVSESFRYPPKFILLVP